MAKKPVSTSAINSPPHPTIEVVKAGYQPTKAEMEEVFTLRRDDGSVPTMEEIAQAVLQPVKTRWIDRPRKRK